MAAVLGRTFLDYFLLWPALSAAAILLENISASFAPPVASYVEQEELSDDLLREEQRQRSARRP